MKLKKIAIYILSAVAALTLAFGVAGCSDGVAKHEGVPVVFDLNGGSYRNVTTPVRLYFDFEKGTNNLIVDIETLSDEKVTMSGYTLEGWYRERTVTASGEEVFSGKWDFSTDTVGDEGVTLYARWVKNLVRRYEVCYRDENGEPVALGSYDTYVNARFRDVAKYCDARQGYSAERYVDERGNVQVRYFNENGEPWDESTLFPNSDTDLTIRVFVNLIEGDFEFVASDSDLRTAAMTGKSIYLLADIDFGGYSFNGFDLFKGKFVGNGHTVSNFNLSYPYTRSDLVSDDDLGGDNLLLVSLFRRIEDASIENVHFSGVKVEISSLLSTMNSLLYAPIAVKMTNSRISDVTFSGEVIVKMLPDSFGEDSFVYELKEACCHKDAASTVEGFTAEINFIDQRAQ